jgi:hypothetical protein
MPITVTKAATKYMAEVTPRHGTGTSWTSPEPMQRDDLIAALRELGCHQTDIGDAFYEADPNWLAEP